MKTTEPHLVDAVRAADDSAALIEGEAKAALVAELKLDPERRGYATPIQAADWRRVLELLHGSYSRSVPAHRVPRDFVTGEQLLDFLRDVPLANALRKGGALGPKWLALSGGICPTITPTKANYTPTGGLMGEFIPDMIADDVLTQDDLTTFGTVEVPESVVMADPRASVVLGAGIVVEASDLAALRAEGLV